MSQSHVGTRTRCGALAIATAASLAIAGVAGVQPASAAPAGTQTATQAQVNAFNALNPVRVSVTTPANPDVVKTITVGCPGTSFVFSPGGQVNNGGGDVILTGIVPNAGGRTVTVSGRLRPLASPRVWSLTAFALCNTSEIAPVRVFAATPTTTISVLCPGNTRVFGTGFLLDAPSNNGYVDRVEPDPTLTQVTVAGERNSAAALTLVAFAVCHPTGTIPIQRIANSEPFDGTWPKIATIQDPGAAAQVYGVGGRVDGPSGIFLDGLVPPATGTNQVFAIANRITPPSPAPSSGSAPDARSTAAIADDDDNTVTVYGTDIGTFCVPPN